MKGSLLARNHEHGHTGITGAPQLLERTVAHDGSVRVRCDKGWVTVCNAVRASHACRDPTAQQRCSTSRVTYDTEPLRWAGGHKANTQDYAPRPR